jgi:hypothetical protein
MTKSQNEKIAQFLSRKGASLTAAQARVRFGVANLRARIYDLREEGMPIQTTMKTTRTSSQPVAFYSLGR